MFRIIFLALFILLVGSINITAYEGEKDGGKPVFDSLDADSVSVILQNVESGLNAVALADQSGGFTWLTLNHSNHTAPFAYLAPRKAEHIVEAYRNISCFG